MGSEVIERLRFLASLPLAGTGQREGGEKMQPFNRFQSRLGTVLYKSIAGCENGRLKYWLLGGTICVRFLELLRHIL